MQAYASAQATPLETEWPLASDPSVAQVGSLATRANVAGTARSDGAASASSLLASLILDGLDNRGLAVLARRLLPHLSQPADPDARGPVAYTVVSLAKELGVSQKTIRSAIARRELSAVKRGSRWIIATDAVQAWATASEDRRRKTHAHGSTTPKAAGPSLRAVLCEGASRRGAR
jgi:excisionase family DNA binding protein